MKKIIILVVFFMVIYGTNYAQSLGGVDLSRFVYGDNSTKTSWFGDPNAAYNSGYYNNYTNLNMPYLTWWHMIISRHLNTANNYQFQLASDFWGDNTYFRKLSDGIPTPWRRILNDGQDPFAANLNQNLRTSDNVSFAKLSSTSNIQTINGSATWDNLNIWSNGVSSFIQSNGDEEGLRIKSNIANKIILESNVGIGTANPTEMLSVNGNIRAKKLIVTQNGWPDYVFSTTYKLRPLAEVADYVQANKHLPDIPSAKEVEEKGLDIGKTQAALLKKIEELTLYIIELKKENVEMKKENSEIKKLFQQSAKQNK